MAVPDPNDRRRAELLRVLLPAPTEYRSLILTMELEDCRMLINPYAVRRSLKALAKDMKRVERESIVKAVSDMAVSLHSTRTTPPSPGRRPDGNPDLPF